MKISELMKTHVVRTTPDATLGEAVDLMDLYQTNGLPVVDAQNRLCGMLTENDVLRALLQADTNAIPPRPAVSSRPSITVLSREEIDNVLIARKADKLYVCDYMTQPAISVSEYMDLRQAAHLMLLHHFKRLPVTDEMGCVVGILNRIDVYQSIFVIGS